VGGSIQALKKHAEALVAASKEICLEVSAEKTKYMIMSGDKREGKITA
jgi:hypothetical protein